MFDAVEGDWPEVELGQVCRIAIGGTPSRDIPQYWSNSIDGFPWASIADLRAAKLSETKEYISQDGVQNSNVKLVQKSTVLMSFKLTIGRTAIADRDIYTNEAIAAFTPNENLDRDFLFYWLPYLAASAKTDQAIKGATLNKQKLLVLSGKLPSLNEQRRIATILQAVDNVLTVSRRTKDQAEICLSQQMMAFMKRGVARSNSKDQETPKSWPTGRCDSFFVLQRGFDITEDGATSGPFQVISSSGAAYTHFKSAVPGPAVITGRKGRLGAVFYSEVPCWPHDTTLWVKDFKGNIPRFIYWKLRSMDLKAHDAATSVPTLNRNNVHALTISLPPIHQQIEISKILDETLKYVDNHEEQVKALKSLRANLSVALLSGRVRVPA